MRSERPHYKGISIKLKPIEYEQVHEAMAKTNYRSLSEYLRKLIFGKPVTVLYRNRSYDEFTEAYIRFKKDLDPILQNGSFTDAQKNWLFNEVKSIKKIVINIYEHVSKSGACEGHPDSIEL